MADLSFLSDSDESAIEEVISQAKDLSVLEQISAINCSSFTTLPTDLDTRFRKLKSFPVATTKTPRRYHSTKNPPFSPSKQRYPEQKQDTFTNYDSPENVQTPDRKEVTKFLSTEENAVFSRSTKDAPDKKLDTRNLKLKSKSGPIRLSPANSSNSSEASLGFSYSKEKSEKRVSDSSSPPVKQGCFLCSPKSLLKKKKKHDGDEEILSGLTKEHRRILQKVVKEELTKEQNRIIQKAIKEEEKISREVDKIVKWAQQASTSMKKFDIHDQPSDHDDDDEYDFDIQDQPSDHDDNDEYGVFK